MTHTISQQGTFYLIPSAVTHFLLLSVAVRPVIHPVAATTAVYDIHNILFDFSTVPCEKLLF